MKPPPLFSSLTLGFWLGTYALRSYVPAAVWNLADELPLSLKPVLAVSTHLIAMFGIVIVLKWRRRTLTPLALAFAAVTFLRQVFIAFDAIGPWLALLSWILWLWCMASLADEVAAHDAEFLIAPAFATAVALQLGLQSAWHGLDLASVRGPVAVVTIAVLVISFAASMLAIKAPALERPHASWAWLVVGPAMFLEVTLVGNVGRVSEMAGLALPVATVLVQSALLIAVVIAARVTHFAARITLIAVGFLALFALTEVRGAAALSVLAVQIVVICGLREAADRRVRISGAAAFTVGALLLFGLIFGFYNFYELPVLWTACFALLGIAAVLAVRAGSLPDRYLVPFFPLSAFLALLYFIPPPTNTQPRPSSGITILSYNIHHGFDDAGVPGMQHTARTIAAMNPDIIALQEIGRGWTLVGGNDLVAYLKWRLPEHQVYFTATNGLLWGNAVMSRLPVREAAGGAFTAAPRILRYGWASAVVSYHDVVFPFYSVHLTADLEGSHGDPRVVQARELLQVIGSVSPVLVAGDFNAHPTDEPIRVLTAELADLGAATGIGRLRTWPAGQPSERIDYVFARGLSVQAGTIPRTLVSDHLPVLLQVQPQHR